MSRPSAILGAVLALATGIAPASWAQPLMPNPGLTTLMQPQPLDRSRPLLPDDRTAGTRSGVRQPMGPGGMPCERRASTPPGTVASPPAGSLLSAGGSGPGIYGRYMPGAARPGDPVAKPDASTGASSNAGSDPAVPAGRPLYAGNDRPLWDTGERRAAAPKPVAAAPGVPATQGAAGSGTAVAAGAVAPPVRDRPLWAGGSLSGQPAATGTPGSPDTAGAGVGLAASPCPAPASGSGTALGR